MPNPLALVGIVDALLTPIHKLISLAIPDFIEQDLNDPAVRARIVAVVDVSLLAQYPEAKLLPEARRKKIISALLDVTLDTILLSD